MSDPNPNADGGLRYSRRHALGLAALGSATLLGIPGCGGDSNGGASGSSAGASANAKPADPSTLKGQTLNLFTWSGYHDPKWLKEYENSRGVKISTQLYGGVPDGFAKVRADPSAFDLVLATSGWVENYADAGAIVPFEESRVPNMKNMLSELKWRDATQYKGKNWACMYTWGAELLCWVPSAGGSYNSWRAMYDPKFKDGKVSLVDDPTTIMPFIPMMLGFKDPYDLNSQQMEQFKTELMKLRGAVDHVSASIDDQTTDFGNRQVDIGVLYNISTQTKLLSNGIDMKSVVPKEGAPAWSDNYAVTVAGAKKADLVYDFINYTMSVPWQARFIAATANSGSFSPQLAKSSAATKAGLDDKAYKATLLPLAEQGAALSQQLKLLKRVPNVKEWLEIWNDFKSGL
jgi:spermidine/putrescine transport system substrate-binding protein